MVQLQGVITGFITILIGVVLIPIIASTVADANVTGTTATVLSLVPVFFGLGILVSSIRPLISGSR